MVTSSKWSWAWVVALVAIVGTVATTGCYKPNIQDGGLHCAPGRACPDGFFCSANSRCKEGTAPKCQASSPHLQPLPNCTPDQGDDCDPVCQSRCDCGRCTFVGATLKCVPPGIKKRGELCNFDNDDCEPGNVCLKDCGGAIARCFRFCHGDPTDTSQCGGQLCNVPVDLPDGGVSGLWVCPPPPQTCTPVGQNDNSCGNAALGCYYNDTVSSTVCDCKGTKQPGDRCSVFNSCVAGYRCVTLNMMMGPTCFPTCTLGGTDCLTGSCAMAGGGNFGYCPP